MPKQTRPKITVGSIQYVHDPEAAKEWFTDYVELFKEELLRHAAHKNKKKEGDEH